ncbi:hypothetical protein FRC04_005743 [Tulasnella sp. 424]|nr:hypothetical protein FRC04_005743 [Tulasnella sp. 424]
MHGCGSDQPLVTRDDRSPIGPLPQPTNTTPLVLSALNATTGSQAASTTPQLGWGKSLPAYPSSRIIPADIELPMPPESRKSSANTCPSLPEASQTADGLSTSVPDSQSSTVTNGTAATDFTLDPASSSSNQPTISPTSNEVRGPVTTHSACNSSQIPEAPPATPRIRTRPP